MEKDLAVLVAAAASIGFFHTLVGPDHYLPFIAMSKTGGWSLRKTTLITFICGIGHILSSVILGIVGVVFGVAVMKLEAIESFRGDVAGWALVAFGLVYFVWGVRVAIRNRPHHHSHSHGDGIEHEHSHSHHSEHLHPHESRKGGKMTPWVLFTIFVFGPCEPLIPLLMYPAATGGLWDLVVVTATFGIATIGTMMAVVILSTYGISFVPVSKMERYVHALGGLTILLCGISIQFLGL